MFCPQTKIVWGQFFGNKSVRKKKMVIGRKKMKDEEFSDFCKDAGFKHLEDKIVCTCGSAKVPVAENIAKIISLEKTNER